MAANYPQCVLLGDSLFEQSVPSQNGFGFYDELANLGVRKIDVINRGFSGWNSRNLLQYLDQIFPAPTSGSPKLKHLVILIGANDAVLPWAPTNQHVPIDEYKENLGKIINHPHIQAHKPKILLVTPPPVDQIKHHKLALEEGMKASIRESAISASYSEKVREVAREHPDVILVDLWQAIMDKAISMAPNDYQANGPWLGTFENGKAGGLDTLLPDGLHMSGDAYRILFGLIRGHIGAEWDGKEKEDIVVYPTWRVINNSEV